MIIATGNVNIDENKAAAENASNDAKNAANSAADEANKVKSTIDGKITTSSVAPFNDGVDHSDGDIWYVQDSDHNTTAMYTYDGSTWNQTKMTTSTMSVGQLSALTANLGTIDSGYINSVTLDSATINSGYIKSVTLDSTTINASTIKGGSISGSSLSLTNGNTNYWLDQNGFHDSYYGNDIFNNYVKKDVWINESGISISDGNYKTDIQPEQIKMSGGGATGTIWSTNINWPAIKISNNIQINSQHVIHSVDYGGLYFEGGSSEGCGLIDIHAGIIYGHLAYLSGNGNSNKGTISLSSPISIDGGGEIITGSGGAHMYQNSMYASYGTFNDLSCSKLHNSSQLSVKKDIEDISTENALNQILSSNIKQYRYKDDDNSQEINIGPIIDDEHEIGSKQYSVSNLVLNENKTAISLDNEIGLLMGAVQELSKRNSDLSLRIASLERKNLNG